MEITIEELHTVCDELFSPKLEGGWELFVESQGVKIYRLYNSDSGLYQYKTYGILSGISPETCIQVYLDYQYRKKWDGYVNELKEIAEENKKGLYWQINFPFMMSNRDYVFRKTYKEMDYRDHHIHCVLYESDVFSLEPERSGVIRVTDYLQKFVLTSDGQGGSKAYIHYYDNPKGMIPAFLINWAAKTGVPAFVKDMEKACKGYQEYKKTTSS